jgi:aryl-alcohol dehydrogenase-like predicted oxidoreductase
MSPSSRSPPGDLETEFVDIPTTSLKVSRVGLGTWAMGGWMWGGTDESQSVATIRTALDQGINLIDTAPVYGFGLSEEIVGKALAGIRSRAIIATKVGIEWRDGAVYRNATRNRIMVEIHASLRRLRTDYVDIYQVHWPDPCVPIDETAGAMRDLYEQGKIRAIGVSNFSVSQLEAFRAVAPLHVVQSPYNLFERGIEAEILPYCLANHIATFGYGALCRGLLSGRMKLDSTFDDGDLRRVDPKFQPPRYAQYLSAVGQLEQLAQRLYGRRVIQLAVRWMLDQGISVALWGGRRPEQLRAALGLGGWTVGAMARAQIDRMLSSTITDPAGPEFMAPPARGSARIPQEVHA